jgi:AcrR family transcriptional regulator
MPSGRRRQFDTNEALGRALDLVWARGYEGATLPELTKALGISRPSLYGAFGNKQQLFLLKRYLYDNNGHHQKRLLTDRYEFLLDRQQGRMSTSGSRQRAAGRGVSEQ